MVVRISLSLQDNAFDLLIAETLVEMGKRKKYVSVSSVASQIIEAVLKDKEVK